MVCGRCTGLGPSRRFAQCLFAAQTHLPAPCDTASHVPSCCCAYHALLCCGPRPCCAPEEIHQFNSSLIGPLRSPLSSSSASSVRTHRSAHCYSHRSGQWARLRSWVLKLSDPNSFFSDNRQQRPAVLPPMQVWVLQNQGPYFLGLEVPVADLSGPAPSTQRPLPTDPPAA